MVHVVPPSAASGRLIQKIHRQLAALISTPPTSGPMASATADTAAQIPSAVACRCGGKALLAIASERPTRAGCDR